MPAGRVQAPGKGAAGADGGGGKNEPLRISSAPLDAMMASQPVSPPGLLAEDRQSMEMTVKTSLDWALQVRPIQFLFNPYLTLLKPHLIHTITCRAYFRT